MNVLNPYQMKRKLMPNLSLNLTLKPNWAALIAATYPPGPEPITVTSASTTIKANWYKTINCLLLIKSTTVKKKKSYILYSKKVQVTSIFYIILFIPRHPTFSDILKMTQIFKFCFLFIHYGISKYNVVLYPLTLLNPIVLLNNKGQTFSDISVWRKEPELCNLSYLASNLSSYHLLAVWLSDFIFLSYRNNNTDVNDWYLD